MRPLRPAAAALVFCGLLQPGAALGQIAGGGQRPSYQLTADELEFDDARDLYEATGNVRIVQEDGQVLIADWVTFSAPTGVGVATGNVRMEDGDQVVEAEYLALNMNTGVSLAGEATLDSSEPGLIAGGRSIQRTGLNRYRIEQGTLTACRCPPKASGESTPPWEVDVSEANVEIGGYGVARNLWFKTLGLPILYVPWAMFPAKTERQTGFLLPTYSTSTRDGVEVEVPFFWAAAENLNVLARPRLIGRRGMKYSASFEYLFGDSGWSEGGAAVLPSDNVVSRDDPETRYGNDRWALWLRHEQPLAPGIRLGASIKRVSDNDYIIDFRDLTLGLLEQEAGGYLDDDPHAPGRNGSSVSLSRRREDDTLRHARFLWSSAWYSYARDALYAGVELSLADDLQSPNDLDRDDYLLQPLPEVRIATLPGKLGGTPLRFAVESRYDYFYRFDRSRQIDGFTPVNGQFFDTGQDALFNPHEPDSLGAFTGGDNSNDDFLFPGRTADQFSQGDGVFQEGEVLADWGHRLDVYPHTYLPVRVGIVETLSEIGYRETLYFPERASSERRGLWTGRFEARSRFSKDLQLGGGVRHVVEPRLGFAFLSTPDQKKDPLFIPASSVRLRRLIDGDLRVLTRNPSDRVADERFLLVQLVNYFYRTDAGSGRRGSEIVKLNVGSGYDFLQDEWTRLFVEGHWVVSPRLRLDWDVGYELAEKELGDAEIGLSWRGQGENFLALRYRYLRDAQVGFENFQFNDDVYGRFESGDTVKQLNINGELAISKRVRLFAQGYVTLQSASNGSGATGIVLTSGCGCWDLIAAIEHKTRPRETRFVLVLNLLGLGQRARVLGYDLERDRDDRSP